MNTHYVQYGDSLTPLGVVLKRKNTSGILTAIDLSGLTVKIIITDQEGTVVVAETTTGVTVTEASAGKVQYDFRSGEDALDPGSYYIYFRVYSGSERDTFPVSPNEMKIEVSRSINA